ncbi:MAG: hypothetical protein NTX17_07700 [Candidatus Eisenbacteria bacterium]|nr:hypothetical protein [Candidatus Eisenbacteria bacterium]
MIRVRNCEATIVSAGLIVSCFLLLCAAALIASAGELYVPSTAGYGVSYSASSSGNYRFTITAGAWSPWPEGSPDDQGWRTFVQVYKNRPVTYEADSANPGKWRPVGSDYGVGDPIYQSTYATAEAIGIGLFVDIPLSVNDYVVLLTPDHQDCFDHNRGGVSFSIENLTNEVRVEAVPATYRAYQNYPNPFNPVCTIRYELPRAGRVNLKVFDVNGSIVRTLVDGWREPGGCSEIWDGRGDDGSALPSGVYLYRFQAGDFVATRKMVLLH